MRISDDIKGYTGQNPFSDSQPRNFSDEKIVNEFFPITLYWSLFNDQHEILLGTRGCGKTFLLKMMRYSMVKTVDNPIAKDLVEKKQFIALYVPMHLEFVAPLNMVNSSQNQIVLFQILFNCLLTNSMIVELNSLLEDIHDAIERAEKKIAIIRKMDEVLFGVEKSELRDFAEFREKIDRLYYSIDYDNFDERNIPVTFKRQICTPLLVLKNSIWNILGFDAEPTWIVCIDEAEFLNETCQKCINNVFRSDSNRIALKVATLPFYHSTLETLVPGIIVSEGNDFSYKIVDMNCGSSDFIQLTNKLCEHRMKTRFDNNISCSSLEDFVGSIGNDDYIDYYRNIVGETRATYEIIKKSIIENFSPQRQKNAPQYSNLRKAVYDKYAPIFFLREMYKLSNKGNNKPGWFAGAKTIRKVSQGNPRMFIQIMSSLFDKAKETNLTPRAQHDVIYKFASDFCESTQALQGEGPMAYKYLNSIAKKIHEKIHEGNLVTGGLSFYVEEEVEKRWIEVAIAYSRVIVDDETKCKGLKNTSKMMLANAYAVEYWLPMRGDIPISISKAEIDNSNSYRVGSPQVKRKKRQEDPNQLTFFEVLNDENNQ